MRHAFSRQSGFSLVELSIVLVILGLLVGGVLGGRNLIRAAELRNVAVEFNHYQTAINTFRHQYNALPGDMPNATQFWDNTQNGNGNWQVQGGGNRERYLFWQHLAKAGLITGEYTGIAGPADNQHHVIGENCPRSRISGLGWSFENDGQNTYGNGNPSSFFWYQLGSMYHLLALGTASANNDTAHGFFAFTPAEAWNLDSKLDDGKPGTGRMHSIFHSSNSCTTATGSSQFLEAEYNVTRDEKRCNILFPNAL